MPTHLTTSDIGVTVSGFPAVVADGDKGDITVSGSGATYTIDALAVTTGKIAADAVDNTKLANVNSATLKGRVTAAAGDPEDLTGTQATTLLDAFTAALKGLAPASGGGTANFLRADASWAAPVATAGDFDSLLTGASTISIDKVRTLGAPLRINDGGGVLTLDGVLALI